MSSKRKLNPLQRGFLQNIFTFCVYLLCLAVAAYGIDWFEKARFISAARQALQKGIISTEAFSGFQQIVDAVEYGGVFMAFFIALLCGAIGYGCIKFSTRFNLVLSATLPKAVEFSSAMRKLGILELAEQTNFVRKHKLSVFIAATGFLSEEQENVRAKLYPFARKLIVSEEIFAVNIGKRTLCLDAEEYEHLLQAGQKRFSLEESAALVEKDEELRSLKNALASLVEDKSRLESETVGLEASVQELKNKVQTQPAQEESRVERLRIERLQWAAFIPAMDRLKRDAPEGKKFTTRELEEAFVAEWAARPDLRDRMNQLTGSEETKPSETLLSAVKAEFKDAGMFSSGGRPRKNT